MVKKYFVNLKEKEWESEWERYRVEWFLLLGSIFEICEWINFIIYSIISLRVWGRADNI